MTDMRFPTAQSDYYCSAASGKKRSSNRRRTRTLASLLVLCLSTRFLCFGSSSSQAQMHILQVQNSRSTTARRNGQQPQARRNSFAFQEQSRSYTQRKMPVVSRGKPGNVRSLEASAVGKTGFLAALQIPVGGWLDYSWGFPPKKGDFNGDGRPDIVTLARDLTSSSEPFSVSVVLSNGDATFQPAVLTPIQSGYCFEFLVGDLNGDHKDDVLIIHSADPSHFVSTVDVLMGNGDGTFTTGNSYTISSNAIGGVTLADVNGDGKLDVVLVDQGPLDYMAQADPARVVTLLGNGDGTFQASTSAALGGACGPYIVAGYLKIADLNGDGLLDVACLGWGGELTVYLATSASVYGPVAAYATIDGHQNLGVFTLGDLNGDGRPEMVAGNGADETITVYINNGDGTFQPGYYIPAALAATPSGNTAVVGPSALAIADVNGDGKADIVSSNDESSDVTVLLGNGDGTFTTPAAGYAVGGSPNATAVVADFDGDGIADVIVSDNEFSLAYLKGYGDGTFRAAHNYYSPVPDNAGHSFGLSIASGDFNGDGQTDFVTTNSVNSSVGFTVYLSRPNGTLSTGVNYGSGGGYIFVEAADFDLDGKLDVAVADETAALVRIFKGRGDGTFAETGQFITDSSNSFPEAITVGDFNRDGYPDLAVLNYVILNGTPSDNVAILLNNHAGGFVLSANYLLSGRAVFLAQIRAGDLKGNGNLDLLVPRYSGPAVAVLSGNGDGTFQPEYDIAVDNTPVDVAVADLNGDGKTDLAVTIGPDPGTNGIDVILGNGDGTFQSPQQFLTSLHQIGDLPLTTDVKIADIDGDGKLDLVYTNSEFGTLGVLFGNGDGTFSGPLEYAVGGFPWGLAVADINHDGAADVVVAGDNFAGVTVLLNANGGAAIPFYSLSPSTSSVDLSGQASATLQITLTSQNYYGGTVSFGCSGLPSQVSCAFSPQTVHVTGNQQAFTTLAVSITGVSGLESVNERGAKSGRRTGFMTLVGVAAFAIVFGGSANKHRKLFSASMTLSLVCVSILFASCGGTKPQPAANAGPRRTYVIQVKAAGVDTSTGRQIANSLSLNLTL